MIHFVVNKLLVLMNYCKLIDAFLSSYHEKEGLALSFGRIRISLEVDQFQAFRLTSSHVNLLLIRSHQAEIKIIVNRFIQGGSNVTREGVVGSGGFRGDGGG